MGKGSVRSMPRRAGSDACHGARRRFEVVLARIEAQVALDVLQMLFHQPDRRADVALLERIDDRDMLGERVLGRVRRLVHQRDQRRARDELGEDAGEHLVAEHAREHDVEVGEQPGPARHVGAADRRLLVAQVAAQLGDLRLAELGGGAPHHRAFEQVARLEDLARLLDARLGDACAACRLERDQLVAAELVQRLADERARDLEDVGDLLLGQLGAGHQPALDDRRGDRVGDALGRIGAAAVGGAVAGGRGPTERAGTCRGLPGRRLDHLQSGCGTGHRRNRIRKQALPCAAKCIHF
jgi:hypothetical protein